MRKALILGALPTPGTGPWVALDGEHWECNLPYELLGCVSIQVDEGSPELLHSATAFSGDRVRAIIDKPIDADVVNITMEKVS